MSALSTSLAPTVPQLPAFPDWSAPIPDTYRQLDGRNHILLNGNNRFLEMHPKGVRTVDNRTQYCILTMMILNFSVPIKMPSWKLGSDLEETVFNEHEPIHLIRSNKTGKYLCMDNKSVIYQSEKNTSDCYFKQENVKNRRTQPFSTSVRYYKDGVTRNKTKKWYIDFNRDNSVRCGNSTSKRHPGANFHQMEVENTSSESPPFQGVRKQCCTRKKCKPKNKDRDSNPPISKKCKKLIKFCTKSRRNFFKLSLKQLRRYYKRCIKNRSEVRKCKKEKKDKKPKSKRRGRQR